MSKIIHSHADKLLVRRDISNRLYDIGQNLNIPSHCRACDLKICHEKFDCSELTNDKIHMYDKLLNGNVYSYTWITEDNFKLLLNKYKTQLIKYNLPREQNDN